MHAINLVDALQEFIQEHTNHLQMATKVKGVFKQPDVFGGYLPPKENVRGETEKDSDYYPFVIVRFLGFSDKIATDKTMDIRLVIGTYSDDEQNGWRENVNLFNTIELALKEKQTVGAFILTGEIDYVLFEEQSKPNWYSTALLSFEAPQIQIDRSGFGDDF
ncbi:MAG: hypothetical protein ABS920_07250 [Sporosarcina sp.]